MTAIVADGAFPARAGMNPRLLDRVGPYAAHLVTLVLARRGWFSYVARIDRAGQKLIKQHRAIIEAAIGPIGQ